jgi:hypothetical protein
MKSHNPIGLHGLFQGSFTLLNDMDGKVEMCPLIAFLQVLTIFAYPKSSSYPRKNKVYTVVEVYLSTRVP